MDQQLFSKALCFAEEAHRGQLRKGSEVPYITHPVGVSAILCQYGYGETVVIAGLLHDVLEDTYVEQEELELQFGQGVARLVASVTEHKTRHGEKVPWEERKQAGVERLKGADGETVALKAADLLHNAQSILRDYSAYGEAVWECFNRGKKHQLWYYGLFSELIAERLGEHPLGRELIRVVGELHQL